MPLAPPPFAGMVCARLAVTCNSAENRSVGTSPPGFHVVRQEFTFMRIEASGYRLLTQSAHGHASAQPRYMRWLDHMNTLAGVLR